MVQELKFEKLKKVTDELEYYAGNTILKNPLIEKSRNLIKTI